MCHVVALTYKIVKQNTFIPNHTTNEFKFSVKKNSLFTH